MVLRSIRGQAAIVGVGQSPFYKRGKSPDREFVLALKAVLAAAADAGLDPKTIDGFVSFANDRNTALRLANSLGIHELRWSGMQWGGGGGGGAGAVQQAAAAVAAGFADIVVVYRALSQGEFGRFGGSSYLPGDAMRTAYGVNSPAELFAARMNRFMHTHNIDIQTQKAVSLASYHHAQRNPSATMHNHPLTPEKYDSARWIVEPWRLYDCCQENDGAAAVIVTNAERARELSESPAFVLGAAMGGGPRSGGFHSGIYDTPDYATAEFTPVAKRLFAMAGVSPNDVDVAQSYENFTGGVVMSLIEHGFCEADEANEFFTLENLIAPTGRLPLNTSGGNLAEAYIHGFELVTEAARQIRGDSSNQVPGAKVSLVSSGPMVTPASSLLLGSEEALG